MQTYKPRIVFNLFAVKYKLLRKTGTASISAKAQDERALKTWKDIPGPSSLPIIGQLLHFLPGGSLHGSMDLEFQRRLYEGYGRIARIGGMLGLPPMVFLFDAEAAEQVLRGEDLMPTRPGFHSLEYYRKVYSRKKSGPIDKPTGLVSEQGENWKTLRFSVNPILLKPKTIKLYANVIDEVALDTVARLKSICHDKNRIQNSLNKELSLWALESIGVVALGGRLNCLDPNLPQDSPARRLSVVLDEVFHMFNEMDLKPGVWKYITTPTYKRAMKVYEEFSMICKYFITKATQKIESKAQTSDDEKTILEKLLEIDVHVAEVMAHDMILAALDSVTNTMISTFYFLACNAEKQEKLREEILSKQERRPYLKACIKETLRIKPIISFIMRKISKDYNIMGYKLPKDTHVFLGHHYLSLMEDQYPRPQEYIPERWIVDKDDPMYHGNAHPFASMPLGFGIRSCIGRRIAELELETLLARAIEHFHIEWFGPPMKSRTTLTNATAPPYNFIFKDLKSVNK